MVTVYFEYRDTAAEKVATFEDEETYMACLPALKTLALQQGYTHITETID